MILLSSLWWMAHNYLFHKEHFPDSCNSAFCESPPDPPVPGKELKTRAALSKPSSPRVQNAHQLHKPWAEIWSHRLVFALTSPHLLSVRNLVDPDCSPDLSTHNLLPQDCIPCLNSSVLFEGSPAIFCITFKMIVKRSLRPHCSNP